MVLVVVFGMVSVVILFGIGVGVGGSKLGLGGVSVVGGVVMGLLMVVVSQLYLIFVSDWVIVVGGVVGGIIGSYLGGCFLLCFVDIQQE